TPLPGSEAVNVTVASETYHPFSPAIPDTPSTVVGPAISMSIFVVEERLHNPAASKANTSTEWRPGPSMNGPPYGCQGPPSMRYRIPATPLVASEASNVTETDEVYQPFVPIVPETEAVVIGATVLIRIVVVCADSTSPAASVAKYSRVYSPSVRTKEPSYTSHVPVSSRYEIRAT